MDKLRRNVLIAGALAPLAVTAWSQSDFRSKPFLIITPFPFGIIDAVARKVGDRITAATGQNVLVEAKRSAGGIVATQTVVRAAPDGHTLLLATANLTIAESLYKKLPYDLERSLVPVAQILKVPNVLVIGAGSNFRTLQDFVSGARSAQKTMSYASPGVATFPHLTVEMLKRDLRFDLLHVPYGGSGPALTSVLSGETQLYSSNLSEVLPHIKAGKLRALAITSAQRSPLLPDVPTIAQATELKDFEAVGWHGFFVPSGTPTPVVSELTKIIMAAVSDPDTKSWLESEGLQPAPAAPPAFSSMMKEDVARWGSVIQRLGLTAE